MSSTVKIRLEPLGESFEVPRGGALRDVLFAYGVEFPCGGHGKCRKCRVKVLEGSLEPAGDEAEILTAEEIADGWRLACRMAATADMTLEIGQWETAILADDTSFSFSPRQGHGVAVDIGTTTLVAQLLDLETGHVLGVRSALNPQTVHGGDIMSRVEHALQPEGAATLTREIRESVGALIGELGLAAGLTEVVLVGNTVMHHLFCGIDVEPLSRYPFETGEGGLRTFRASELAWNLPSNPVVQFLPCLGGFVGSDILAGIMASGFESTSEITALLDLGTNGEIVVGNRNRIVCASTAAGPAFEGGKISSGMRAATGAIAAATVKGGALSFEVLGGEVSPRGICGSGLVDVIAGGLDLGLIEPNGRFAGGRKQLLLAGSVRLLQKDIRELQLAKGAVAAGVRLLLKQRGARQQDVRYVYLAGAFGNYVNRESARRIGILDFPAKRIHPSGNTALLGAKLALFRTEPEGRGFNEIRERITHVSLAADPEFQDTFVDSLAFPPVDGG